MAQAGASGSGTAGAKARGQVDLVNGPIAKSLLVFTIPTLASNILQSLNGSINSIWVGRFLGEEALAATANANLIMFLLVSLVFGFGMAATVMIGQSMGARNIDAARRAFGSAIGFTFILASASALIGWFAAPAILRLLGTPGHAFDLALAYLRVIFIAMPATLVSITVSMGLRGAGDSLTPLRFMILSAVLDIGLNPLLILGAGPIPAMGIAGSATATALAGVVSMVALVIYVYRKDLPIRLRGAELAYLRPAFDQLRVMIAKGIPMGLQMIVMAASGLVMISLVNHEGMITAAAYGASQQLWTYLQMPAIAIGAGVSAMAAQNIGARRWDRVNRITALGVGFSIAITGTVIGILLLFDRPALALFLGGASPAIDVARHMQFLASWSFLMFGVSMTLFGTMRANGVVVLPLIVLIIALYPVRLGFYHFTYPHLGADAIWLSFPAGSVVSLGLSVLLYLQGGWRKARMVAPPTEEECVETVNAESEPAGRMSPTG